MQNSVASAPQSDVAWSPKVSRLADFEIFGEQGEGSTGKVMRARHRATGQMVALKLYDSLYWHEGLMWNEATKLRLLAHPHLPKLLAFWEEEHAVCLVTALVDGPNLWQEATHETIRSLPLAEALDCAVQVSAGLVYLHERGIIHTDVKPGNMVRDRAGQVVLVDFEGAIFEGEEGHKEMGSWGYTAPELERGLPTPRSDVYALGLSLWQLLCGTLPEPQERVFPPLPEECPPALAGFLRRMIAMEESQRPDAEECMACFQALATMSASTKHYKHRSNWLLPPCLRWWAAGRRAAERLTLRLGGRKLLTKQLWQHNSSAVSPPLGMDSVATMLRLLSRWRTEACLPWLRRKDIISLRRAKGG